MNPNGACKQCQRKKLKCSLMPLNEETGKTDRRPSNERLYQFRVKQVVKAGKKRALDSPDTGEAEGSGQAPSPLSALYGLETLALESGASSAAYTPADTPADSPATVPQPTLTENIAPPSPPAPKTRKTGTSRSPAGESVFRPPASASTQNTR